MRFGTVWPTNVKTNFFGLSAGESPHGGVPTEITAPRHEFLTLDRQSFGPDGNACANRGGIRLTPQQSYVNPSGTPFVAIDSRPLIEVINDHVQIAIAIQIGQGHSMTDAIKIETPLSAHFLETRHRPTTGIHGFGAEVPKGQQRRVEACVPAPLGKEFRIRFRSRTTKGLQFRRHIQIA